MHMKNFLWPMLGLAAQPGFAADASTQAGIYLGLFGGRGVANSSSLKQQGAVLINPHLTLPIQAVGPTNRPKLNAGGVQLGYEWSRQAVARTGWRFSPALELEGLYLGKHRPHAEMPVRPRALGTQYVTLPMTGAAVLANAVFTFQSPYSEKLLPYFGLGLGAASLSVKGSDSFNPSEPGINHFNSGPDASDTAFALQLKAGVKAELRKNLHFFTEYRHLSVRATRYTFGETDYPGVHLPTTPWNVSLGRQQYHFLMVGLQYRF